jgi:CelD/BcsL family acetyltransferase involved in cellulose biosynthesis
LHTVNDYQFTCSPLDDINVLKQDWLILESKSNSNFFLSWSWINTWIETYQPELRILRAYRKGEMVAIAALVLKRQRRYLLINSRTLHVHQTGDPDKDQIWIEYNGILAKQEHEEAVTKAAVKYLIEFLKIWDELIVGAITDHEASIIENAGDLMRHDLWEAPCYGVDLKSIRYNNTDYLTTLSRNTRYQIRRSIKLYEKNGKLSIDLADNKAKALKYFEEIGPLHIERWGAGNGESGFVNPYFTLFHRNLIKKYWEAGAVELIRMKVGDKVIARFYNFIYRNRVYFYLSGLMSETDNKLKPGLTGHALCIQKYIDEGFDFYDFMGGGERYKSNLAVQHQHLVKVTLQKRKLRFKLEKLGRKIKSIIVTLI